ncbi:unnamed protein product, partial [Rangifer tarandus platyrhynchus]
MKGNHVEQGLQSHMPTEASLTGELGQKKRNETSGVEAKADELAGSQATLVSFSGLEAQ